MSEICNINDERDLKNLSDRELFECYCTINLVEKCGKHCIRRIKQSEIKPFLVNMFNSVDLDSDKVTTDLVKSITKSVNNLLKLDYPLHIFNFNLFYAEILKVLFTRQLNSPSRADCERCKEMEGYYSGNTINIKDKIC